MPRRMFSLVLVVCGFALLVGVALVADGRGRPAARVLAAPAGSVAAPTQVAAAQAGARRLAPAGAWSAIATFPAALVSPTPGTNPLLIKRAAAAAYPPNGNVYLLGGRHGLDGQDTALRWIWEYSPSANTWLMKNALLDGTQQGSIFTSNMATAVLTDSTGVHIYAVGGNSVDDVVTSTVRVYDPVADSLSFSDPWPANPPRLPGGWAVYSNTLYIFGGFSYQANNLQGGVFTDTWKFDPLALPGAKWSQVSSAPLSLGRAFTAGATLDGFIYAIGGNTWVTSTQLFVPQTIVERLNPQQPNPTWAPVASLPTARGDMGAWAYDTGTNYEIAGKIAVAGGHWDIPDNVGYLYDPGLNTWTSFPTLVYATRNYGTAQLNGFLYALGGYDYSAGTPNGANFNQRYDATIPATPTATSIPPTITPTATAVPPTPTETSVLPSSTPEPPTLTPEGPSATPSETPGPPTSTPGPPPTSTPCPLSFSDVQPTDYFYTPVLYLACHGVISGYADGTFRPYANTTRAQMVKIIVLSFGIPITTPAGGAYTFQDVAPDFPFFAVIETAAAHNIVSGYTCGQAPAGPCVPPNNRPYFLPYADVTRGQLSKIDVVAAAWPLITPPLPAFTDVPPGSAFYSFVETAVCHGVISGYADHTFRPGNNAIRGQIAKIVYLSVTGTGGCSPSSAGP